MEEKRGATIRAVIREGSTYLTQKGVVKKTNNKD